MRSKTEERKNGRTEERKNGRLQSSQKLETPGRRFNLRPTFSYILNFVHNIKNIVQNSTIKYLIFLNIVQNIKTSYEIVLSNVWPFEPL